MYTTAARLRRRRKRRASIACHADRIRDDFFASLGTTDHEDFTELEPEVGAARAFFGFDTFQTHVVLQSVLYFYW